VTDRPAVSVIVCTWNRAATLQTTLQSLSEQQGLAGDEVEVIVVDNNSTDGTRATVEGMQPTWPLGQLRYVFEPRQGKQYALNSGIVASRYAVLAFTDDDILISRDWLSSAQALFTDAGVDLAGGRTQISWPDAGMPAWFAHDMRAVVGGVDLGDERLDPPPDGYAPAGANLVARRDLFDRVGAFSEAHFRHMDFEFGIRCRQAGACVVYAPQLVVHAPVDPRCLNRRYFRRWAFKAGIARDQESQAPAGRWPAVPRWLYRQVLQDAICAVPLRLAGSAADSFSRELRMWRGLGTIASASYAWLRPSGHQSWVRKYSQKVNDVY
jgi:glycosyltransferase involved in cell wall biosynthesis